MNQQISADYNIKTAVHYYTHTQEEEMVMTKPLAPKFFQNMP